MVVGEVCFLFKGFLKKVQERKSRSQPGNESEHDIRLLFERSTLMQLWFIANAQRTFFVCLDIGKGEYNV